MHSSWVYNRAVYVLKYGDLFSKEQRSVTDYHCQLLNTDNVPLDYVIYED